MNTLDELIQTDIKLKGLISYYENKCNFYLIIIFVLLLCVVTFFLLYVFYGRRYSPKSSH